MLRQNSLAKCYESSVLLSKCQPVSKHPEGTSKNPDKPNNSENSVNMGVYENFFSIFRESSEKTTKVNQNVITYYFSRYKGGPNHVETL